MLRHSMLSLPLVLALTQLGSAQDTVKELKRVVQQTATAAAKSVAEQLPAPAPGPCIELDVLIGCVAFDEKGELRVKKEGAEPEINRAGTLGANLAAKLNEQRDKLPAGVSPGAAGANFLLQGLAGEEKIESLEQFRLRLNTDGTEARLQNGSRMPRIVGTSMRGNAITNSVEFEQIGVMVGGSAKITKTGKIALALEIEKSAFGPEEEGTPVSVNEGKTLRTPRIDVLVMNTQITVADREPMVLTSQVRLWGDKVTETFVVITASVEKP